MKKVSSRLNVLRKKISSELDELEETAFPVWILDNVISTRWELNNAERALGTMKGKNTKGYIRFYREMIEHFNDRVSELKAERRKAEGFWDEATMHNARQLDIQRREIVRGLKELINERESSEVMKTALQNLSKFYEELEAVDKLRGSEEGSARFISFYSGVVNDYKENLMELMAMREQDDSNDKGYCEGMR